MYCKNCGEKMTENAEFCVHCGGGINDSPSRKSKKIWGKKFIPVLCVVLVGISYNYYKNHDGKCNVCGEIGVAVLEGGEYCRIHTQEYMNDLKAEYNEKEASLTEKEKEEYAERLSEIAITFFETKWPVLIS